MTDNCNFKDHFETHEKIIMRVGFLALILIAFFAILMHSASAAIVYLIASMIGGLLVVYCFLCVYCPYPYHFSDCLFMPYQLITGVAKEREGECGAGDMAGLTIVMMILLVFPQYWLFQHMGMAIAFWAILVFFAVAFPMIYCNRCRHQRCMFNRA